MANKENSAFNNCNVSKRKEGIDLKATEVFLPA